MKDASLGEGFGGQAFRFERKKTDIEDNFEITEESPKEASYRLLEIEIQNRFRLLTMLDVSYKPGLENMTELNNEILMLRKQQKDLKVETDQRVKILEATHANAGFIDETTALLAKQMSLNSRLELLKLSTRTNGAEETSNNLSIENKEALSKSEEFQNRLSDPHELSEVYSLKEKIFLLDELASRVSDTGSLYPLIFFLDGTNLSTDMTNLPPHVKQKFIPILKRSITEIDQANTILKNLPHDSLEIYRSVIRESAEDMLTSLNDSLEKGASEPQVKKAA